MHKKTDIQVLEIPKDDVECWERYPKNRWVYDLSRLLDAQDIKWSPYEITGMLRELNIHLETEQTLSRQPGFIYIDQPAGKEIITEVFITKGEIKLMRHLDKTHVELDHLIGEIELRINSFVSIYFHKFTGIISITTYGNKIYAVKLRPYVNFINEKNQEAIRLAKRIYKKHISL